MSFKSIPSSDRWYGLLAMLGLLGVDILLIAGLRTRPVDGLTFILVLIVLGNLLALFYLGYRSFGALTLEYWVDRDGVTLVWGPTRPDRADGYDQKCDPAAAGGVFRCTRVLALALSPSSPHAH